MKKLLIGGRYLLLALGAVAMLLPFVWMVVISLQPAATTLTLPTFAWSSALHWENYRHAWRLAPFAQYYGNSLLVTATTTDGQLFTSILAAFAFSHLHFYGRRLLFRGLIALTMIPGELLLIPNFITLTHLHWINTYAALIVPWLTSIFAMFALRQAFLTHPQSLYYAARLEGASDWQYLWHVLVPLNRPVITAVGILQAIGSWNAFMWPLIVTNSPRLRTLPVGLMTFTSQTGTNYPLLMAATVFVVVPLLILYLALQKYIVAGITRANLKG